MASKLINLIALSTLAILASSFGSTNVNALSVSSNHHARSVAHQAFAAKKRAAASGRPKCKPRPSSSAAAPGSTGAPAQPAAQPAQPAPAPPAQGNPTPPPASSGGKGLLAWGAGSRPDLLKNLKVGSVSAIYNWNPEPFPEAEAAGYEYIPNLWGERDVDFVRNNIKPGQYAHILGFNEPDHGEQGNMDPGRAAQLYKEIMVPLHNGGTRVSSPAVSNGPNGLEWFKQFVQACGSLEACGVDFISAHCYATDTAYVQKTFQDWHDTYGLNVWVTESAAMDFVTYQKTDVTKFASEMAAWANSQPWIEKYSAFMVADNLGNVDPSNAIISGSNFNALGNIYYG
ncbi:glycosyl hydrolase catalytic core-domain-containing protein [Crepidotus variabilis]|uniref:Glycosyl hydrolase catalytic core-domain-containing protein n=1 Tax=Crepidotus variabilis TaxID=179855 RepID=A0A9P6ES42_9AGAR|nr:glycosyl hydrolase catalytic core-domain-containing protein [Crepidotus variabilis]